MDWRRVHVQATPSPPTPPPPPPPAAPTPTPRPRSINPFMSGSYNPVLALDVFLVQAATNTLLGHFLSLLCSLWLLNVISEGRGFRFQVGGGGGELVDWGPPAALASKGAVRLQSHNPGLALITGRVRCVWPRPAMRLPNQWMPPAPGPPPFTRPAPPTAPPNAARGKGARRRRDGREHVRQHLPDRRQRRRRQRRRGRQQRRRGRVAMAAHLVM
jgi:uncharacterized membrane protein